MKRLFYLGVVLLAAFEIANVFFIMPMPGSQRIQSIDLAYLLYRYRWLFRVWCGAMIVAGAVPVWRSTSRTRWLAPGLIAAAALVTYVTNFQMAADHIFIAPTSIIMRAAEQNAVDTARVSLRSSGPVPRRSSPCAATRSWRAPRRTICTVRMEKAPTSDG